jgi:hypothetical protein
MSTHGSSGDGMLIIVNDASRLNDNGLILNLLLASETGFRCTLANLVQLFLELFRAFRPSGLHLLSEVLVLFLQLENSGAQAHHVLAPLQVVELVGGCNLAQRDLTALCGVHSLPDSRIVVPSSPQVL